MCSVVGYVGARESSSFILEGLSRSEYRGYDSAGFACISRKSSTIEYVRAVGGLCHLVRKVKDLRIDGQAGIGHSRWATHGKPSENNAHPHLDCQETIAIVHNGIIENYRILKEELERLGHLFRSDTDTEVLAHLLESLLLGYVGEDTGFLREKLVVLMGQLQGSYALLALLKQFPGTVIAARKRSPLCIGMGNNEIFIASDVSVFWGKTKHVFFPPDESFILITKDTIAVYDFFGTELRWNWQRLEDGVSSDWYDLTKGEYEHYMLKEIYDQPEAIHKTMRFLRSIQESVDQYLGLSRDQLRDLQTISLVGCGTSWHAARVAQFFFEEVVGISTSVHLASEFRYMPFFPAHNKLHIAISQSGETADTLEAMRVINIHSMSTVALTNSGSSTMVREAGGFLLTQAGREIAVASTKAFSTQLVTLYWLAHRIAFEKNSITSTQMETVYSDVAHAAAVMENTIIAYENIISDIHAKQYAHYNKAIFLGRHSSYPFAMEAALKLKEIAYIFSQCYPAGELKHGPLALIDEHTPVFVFSHQDNLIYQKLLSNVQEVKARDGHIVAFVFEGQHELRDLADVYFEVPTVASLLGPLAMTGVMQFFVYAIARECGLPIDKPRNLAKSVTVE